MKKRSPFLVFLCCALAVPTCGGILGELVLDGLGDEAAWLMLRPWLATGVLLGIAHVLLRPVLRLLSAPVGCLTLGLFGLVIDVGLIWACGMLVEDFGMTFACMLVTALVINTICAAVHAR